MEKFIEKYGSPFKILGLNNKNNNTEEDVKKAYKKLSLKYHPDKNNNLTIKEYLIIQKAYKYCIEIVEFQRQKEQNDKNMKKTLSERTQEYQNEKNNFKIKNLSIENELRFGEERLGKVKQTEQVDISQPVIVKKLNIKNEKEFNKVFDYYSKKNNQIVKYKNPEGYQDDILSNYTRLDKKGNYIDEFYDESMIGKYKKMFWSEVPTEDSIKKIKNKK
jgi:curved DNA-binding protein CbpA